MGVFQPSVKRSVFQGHRSQVLSNAQIAETASPTSELYKELPSEHATRLLILHLGSNIDDPISCALTVCDFDKKIPKYNALSYVWGKGLHPRPISVNGHDFKVTRNLYEALTHIRSPGHDRIFWVDAICINQKDLDEKSRQVPLMRDIYMEAEQVVSYLGPATKDLDLHSPQSLFQDISSRSYWSRVWIFQEFVLAKANVLQCGDMCFRLQDLLNQLKDSRELKDSTNSEGPMALFIAMKKAFRSGNNGIPLKTALRVASTLDATNPRDKIYGILGLVNKPYSIEPDYSLSPCDVIYRAIQATYLLDLQGLPPKMQRAFQESNPYLSPKKKVHNSKSCNGKRCGSENVIKSWPLDGTSSRIIWPLQL